MSDENEIILDTQPLILAYLWNTHLQVFQDEKATFRYDSRGGHAEFYAYGPNHIAVCVYEYKEVNDIEGSYSAIGQRIELLTLKVPTTSSMVDLAAKEMCNMIKRKRIGPVTRRIKT